MPLITNYLTLIVQRAASSRLDTTYGVAPAHRPHVICVLFAGDVWGFGEASPLVSVTGETTASVQAILEERLLPNIVGKDPLAIAAIHEQMQKVLPANTSAKAAVDGALFDLAGKLTGLPSCSFLGGACRTQVKYSRPIGIHSLADTVTKAKELTATGTTTLKMKVGLEPATDVARVKAVRDVVGNDIRIRIDANQGYTYSQAYWVMRQLREVGLEYMEQPLPDWDVEGAAALRRETGVPVAADEGVKDTRGAMKLIAANAADVFILKLVKMGGAWPARQIAALAAASGIQCVVTSTFDTHIGGAMCLHLALSIPNATLAHELTVFPTQPELAETEHRVEGAMLHASMQAGLGIKSIAELDTPRPPEQPRASVPPPCFP